MLVAGTVRYFTTTIANVENTAALTTFCNFTIPASSLEDGNVIHVVMSVKTKNNKGTSGTANMYCVYDTDSIQISDESIPNSATEGKSIRRLYIQRVGSDLWISTDDNSFENQNWQNDYLTSANGGGIITNPGFASDKVLYLKLQLSAADATFYFKPQIALAYKIG